MSRLTQRDGDSYVYEEYMMTRGGSCTGVTRLRNQAIDKLGELEDIEEELGIDLITFVKLAKAKEIYDIEEDDTITFTYVDFEDHLIVCVDDFSEMCERYNEWCYRVEDHGKTWALTKEELQ